MPWSARPSGWYRTNHPALLGKEIGKMNSNGKVALVTGGGSGIGKAAAIALAKEGFAVVVAGRRPEPLQAVVGEIEGLQGRALGVPTDVGDPAAVRNLFAKTKSTYGRLDVLFNNAGFGAAAPIEELPFERWQAVVNSILTGSFLCTQEAFKIMKDQTPMGGRIINNGSISAHVPRPHSVAYTSCKHAITGLTKSTSLDGRKYDIACGQVDVGNALTEMTQRMQRGVPQANGTVMEEPVMDVQNVARAVVFMATVTPEANVQFLTVMATKMPFVGRG
jgi:NAD(P)-dependent dehydrogenase (short-subunit alcohol dehydrogenase family)